MTQQMNRSYAGGHYELSIQGSQHSAYVKSFDGGKVKNSPVKEAAGHMSGRTYHVGLKEYEPYSFDIGMSAMGGILDWARNSWSDRPEQRHASLSHGDFELKIRGEDSLTDAWLKKVTFPALGEGGKDMYLKVEIQPEKIKYTPATGDQRLKADVSTKQKLWNAGAFRLTLDGFEKCMQHTNKLESFFIEQKLSPLWTGSDDFPTYEACAIEMPSMSGTLSSAYAKPLMDWRDKYLIDGVADVRGQRTGMLEYLHPNRKDVLFDIQLYEILPDVVGFEPIKANADGIKRHKFSLKIGRISLSGKGLGIA